MKKVKILIAVLVCSVMMMGIGYAWYNDSITMATTAKTGTLNVEFADAGEITDSQSGYITGSFAFGTKYVTTTVTETVWVQLPGWCQGYYKDVEKEVQGTVDNKKELRCTLNNLYPGAYVDVEVTVENVGSIPVRLKDVALSDIDGDEIGNLTCELLWDANNNSVLKNGETNTYTVRVSVKDETKWNNNTQDKSATFDIQFNWIQFNEI